MRRPNAAWIFPGSPDQRHRRGAPARRLLCRRHRRRVDLVRHARHRQHRASGLHHPRLLHRLFLQHQFRRRSDHRQHRGAAGVLRARRAGLSGLLRVVRETRPGIAARPRFLLRPAVRHRSRADPGVRRRLPLRRGRLYRPQRPSRLDRFAVAHAGALPGGAGDVRRAAALRHPHLSRPRHHGGVAGPVGACS